MYSYELDTQARAHTKYNCVKFTYMIKRPKFIKDAGLCIIQNRPYDMKLFVVGCMEFIFTYNLLRIK